MVAVQCDLWGHEFQPLRLVEAIKIIPLRNILSPGEIGKTGVHKGKPVPYGCCTIETPSEIPLDKKIEWMAEFVDQHSVLFKKLGATDIDFEIFWEGIQGNMELTAVELKKLAKLEIPISMTYIHL
jgi:hypothetical protein